MAPTKEELLAYRERMARYNAWEAENPASLTPQQAIAAVSSLYDLLSVAARDPGPFSDARSVYARLIDAARG